MNNGSTINPSQSTYSAHLSLHLPYTLELFQLRKFQHWRVLHFRCLPAVHTPTSSAHASVHVRSSTAAWHGVILVKSKDEDIVCSDRYAGINERPNWFATNILMHTRWIEAKTTTFANCRHSNAYPADTVKHGIIVSGKAVSQTNVPSHQWLSQNMVWQNCGYIYWNTQLYVEHLASIR